jgi:putative oxidoreductase
MQGFRKEDNGADGALALVRIAVAALLFVHGVTRFVHGGVVPFGGWLAGQGIPFGLQVAWAVTIYELVAAPLLVFGIRRLVTPLCIGFATIYAFGIWLVHWPEGWFVVGAGRNGMEYSVLLIVCLLALAWRGWGDFVTPRKRH